MTAKYGTLLLKNSFDFLFKMVFHSKPLDNVNDIQTLRGILANKFVECMLNFLQCQSLFDINIILKNVNKSINLRRAWWDEKMMNGIRILALRTEKSILEMGIVFALESWLGSYSKCEERKGGECICYGW